MQVESVGNTGGAINVDAPVTTVDDSFSNALNDAMSSEGKSDDTLGMLLKIIEMLMGLIEGKGGEGKGEAGSSATDSLSDSLEELSSAIDKLTNSVDGADTGASSENVPAFDSRDMNQDGQTTVFEVVDSFTSNMDALQSRAKTPLDYVAGGRSVG